MSNQIPLSADALKAIERASVAARERHHPYIDVEHLLVGALENDFASQAATHGGLTLEPFLNNLRDELGMVRDDPMPTTQGLTLQAKEMLVKGANEALRMERAAMTSSHLALTILQNPSPVIQEILQKLAPVNLEAMRDYLRENLPNVQPFNADLSRVGVGIPVGQNKKLPVGRSNTPNSASGRRVTVSFGQPKTKQRQSGEGNGLAVIGAAIGVLVLIAYASMRYPDEAIPFFIVLGGWIISLTLHEFGHAFVAYLGGDDSVKDKGYLTMNPLKYTHPLLSIALPLLFLFMGGIGLPGGAVYIERDRIIRKHNGTSGYGRGATLNAKTRYWLSAVSLAGPFANFICLIIFSAPFWTGYITLEKLTLDNITFWGPMAFLCWLQVVAILLNLLPIPPLDGFGAIEPFLPTDLAFQMRTYGAMGFLLVILLFWSPSFSRPFFNEVDSIAQNFSIPPALRAYGYEQFTFWEEE